MQGCIGQRSLPTMAVSSQALELVGEIDSNETTRSAFLGQGFLGDAFVPQGVVLRSLLMLPSKSLHLNDTPEQDLGPEKIGPG
mmetsp:Transcript_15750/g.47264  ORF Transcript_15750/g.47264 Transcript_15750/m.47264 type:complete len:83 (-) Transcript_15750:169-417(-)